MKKLLLFLTLFSVFFFSKPTQSRASHFLGGEISWECINSGFHQGKMIFTFKLYCACYIGTASCPSSSINMVNPLYSMYGGVSTIVCNNVSVREISNPDCYDPLQRFTCGQTLAAGGTRAMKEYVFNSAPVQINGIPASTGSHFDWSSCCRPATVNLSSQGSFWLRATIFPYTDPSTNTTLSFGSTVKGPSCYDSSPFFAESVVPVACAGANTTLPLGCFDYDYDSLSYNWAIPMQSPTNPAVWAINYSTTSPFPNTLHDPSNVPATLDSATGLISFNNMVLNGSSYHAYCIQVSSYRNGQKLADVYRDVPITIFNCAPGGINTPPQISLKDGNKTNYKMVLDTAIAVGSYIELDLRSIDTDTLPTSNPTNLQSLDISVTGNAMSYFPNNNQACANKPCAFLDTMGNVSWDGNLGRFIDSGQVNVVFKWQPDCGLLYPNNQSLGQPSASSFVFNVHSGDNNCLLPGQSTLQFKITVYDSSTAAWPFKEIDASNDDARLKWDPYNYPDFQSYNVYRSSGHAGPWTLIHDTSAPGAVTYHDLNAQTDRNIYYYMLRVNKGTCIGSGKETMNMKLTVSQVWEEEVELNWNNPEIDPDFWDWYSVYRRYDSGSWAQIAYTGSNWFRHYTPFFSRYSYYRVEMTDLKGINFISNVVKVEMDTPRYITPVIPPKIVDDVRFLPNPFRNELILIDQSGELLGETIVFYNVLGDRVYEYRVQEVKSKIDLKGLKQGVYFVHYKDIDGNTISRRLVKME